MLKISHPMKYCIRKFDAKINYCSQVSRRLIASLGDIAILL